MTTLENFIEAFSRGGSSCRETCDCGVMYYDGTDNDLSDEEIEELEKSNKVFSTGHSIGLIAFGGKEYAQNCDCWVPKAKQVMEFIDSHNFEIADYLRAEKKRKIDQAEAMPTVV